MRESGRLPVVLVTGSSSGFGELIALRLARRGCRVFASMRKASERASKLVDKARQQGVAELISCPELDVTSVDNCTQTVKAILTETGRLDALVNNAGFGMGGFFEDLDDQDFRSQFEVNFFGVLNVVRAALPDMRRQGRGRIINISSMAAFSGTPAFSAYCSSKWALEGFSECLFMELKPFGVDVVLVEPGSYRTEIFDSNARYARRFHDPSSPYYKDSMHLKGLVSKHIHQSRRDPEEVAAVVERVVFSGNPPLRNIVGFVQVLRRLMAAHLPFEFYAWMVNRALGRQLRQHKRGGHV